jgi:hypothetical protein
LLAFLQGSNELLSVFSFQLLQLLLLLLLLQAGVLFQEQVVLVL